MSVVLPSAPPYTCAVCGRAFEHGHSVARNAAEAVCFADCGGYAALDQRAAAAKVGRAERVVAILEAEQAPRGADGA